MKTPTSTPPPTAYARRFSGGVGAWFVDVQARATLELLRPWPHARVLDVGRRTRAAHGPARRAGHEVTVHGSDEVCAARVRAWLDAGRARFRSGDCCTALARPRLRRVRSPSGCCPTSSAGPSVVSELCRVARRAVIFDYPTARSVNVAGRRFVRPEEEGRGQHAAVPRVRRLRDRRRVRARAGFRPDARRRRSSSLPMALHRALRRGAALEDAGGVPAAALGARRALGSPVILSGSERA